MGRRSEWNPKYSTGLTVEGVGYQVTVCISKGPMAAEQVPVHSHPQFELLAFYDGELAMQVEDGPWARLHGGQCCLIHPDAYHLRQVTGNATKFYTMFIHGLKKGNQKEPYLLLSCAPEILRRFADLEEELSAPGLGTDSNLRALCNLILVSVLRELALRQEDASRQHKPVKGYGVARYEDSIDDYFSLRYAEDVSVGELAEQLGITPRHLARIMQRSYGCTFRQRLLEIRLYHARRFLAATQLPVSTIAMRCGFAAERAFTQAFHKKIGCTPTQYRRKKQET